MNRSKSNIASINTKISLIFFFLLISIVFSGNKFDNVNIEWHFLPSKTSDDLKEIFEYNNSAYTFARSPYKLNPTFDKLDISIKNIRQIFVKDDIFWFTQTNDIYESYLYKYKNGVITQIPHPLINDIYAMYFKNENEGWLGTVGELVHYENGTYTNIELPINYGMRKIFYCSDRLWIQFNNLEVYSYHENHWEKHFDGENVKKIKIINGNIYFLTNKSFYLWLKEHPVKIFENNTGKNFLSFYLDKFSTWFVGDNGIIGRLSNGNMEINSIGESLGLYDIYFSKDGVGYIVGKNGLILTTKDYGINYSYTSLGFTSNKVGFGGKNVDEEYGVVINDLNNDGNLDIYVACVYEPNRAYIKKGNAYINEAVERNLSGKIFEEGKVGNMFISTSFADFNNDGDRDAVLACLNDVNRFFVNNGNGEFTDYTKYSGITGDKSARTNTILFGDFDNDGDLDLLVINENSSSVFYLNDGNGYFIDKTKEVGLFDPNGGVCAVFADIDNDNDLDIIVTNWSNYNKLYINKLETGVLFFKEEANERGLEHNRFKKSNGAAFADIDNDGDLDLFITNRKTHNEFYSNNGKGFFSKLINEFSFTDTMKTYGVSIADFDNDGLQDVYLANIGKNKLYKQIDSLNFIDVSEFYGVDLDGYSTGTAWGDIDFDGDLDLYCANFNGESSLLFVNNCNNKNFITINFQCSISNIEGFGAKVFFYKKDGIADKNKLIGFRELNSVTSYASQNYPYIHFGFPSSEPIDVEVYFPASGIKKKLNSISPGTFLTINEVDGAMNYYYRTKRFLTRASIDQFLQIEAVKFLVFISLLIGFYLSIFSSIQNKLKFKLILVVSVVLYIVLQSIFYLHESFYLAHIIPFATSISHFSIAQMLLQRKESKEHLQIEREAIKNKISRDLHDDIAANLSTAAIYLDIVNEEGKSDNSYLQKISKLLNDSQRSLSDIVWALSSKSDMLDNLLSRIKLLAIDQFKLINIKVEFIFPDDCNEIKISNDRKRNLYLIVKEAFTNIVKHSKANNVKIEVNLKDDNLIIDISDDGIGINLKENESKLSFGGNGINNIKKRAEEVDAGLEIKNRISGGTQILISCKMINSNH